ncbi:MAG: PQQ-dependent sugar dehydrogenase, partial [Gemmatimonadota bacterium]|nr:PQQ-dependent sugar dehydrogenase [Gemmatimonadota bacterium]
MKAESSRNRSINKPNGTMVVLGVIALAGVVVVSGFASGRLAQAAPPVAASAPAIKCDAGNGGITLPEGFCATIFADSVGLARHMAVAANGDVFVALQPRRAGNPGGVLVLRDVDKDGHAEKQERFGPLGGGGIALQGNSLYLDVRTAIVRFNIPTGAMQPSGPPDTIVSGLPMGGNHTSRDIELDGKGNLFVNVGSSSNACEVDGRAAGSKGIDPCVELETRAGIWKFSATQVGQKFSAASRFVTGLRNAVGLAWNAKDNALYATQHGRDSFVQHWPALYDEKKSAENPAEELVKAESGDNFGWPYCYYDIDLKHLVMAPEYGGDAKSVGRCSRMKSPVVAFPGHWAPNAVTFYTGTAFPARYRDGAFLAFHGSWNRAPRPQAGYKVVFVPRKAGRFDGTYETFADHFAGPGSTDLEKG